MGVGIELLCRVSKRTLCESIVAVCRLVEQRVWRILKQLGREGLHNGVDRFAKLGPWTCNWLSVDAPLKEPLPDEGRRYDLYCVSPWKNTWTANFVRWATNVDWCRTSTRTCTNCCMIETLGTKSISELKLNVRISVPHAFGDDINTLTCDQTFYPGHP